MKLRKEMAVAVALVFAPTLAMALREPRLDAAYPRPAGSVVDVFGGRDEDRREREKELRKEEKERAKELRKAEKERLKDLREAQREQEKDLREAERERLKDLREAERERRKKN